MRRVEAEGSGFQSWNIHHEATKRNFFSQHKELRNGRLKSFNVVAKKTKRKENIFQRFSVVIRANEKRRKNLIGWVRSKVFMEGLPRHSLSSSVRYVNKTEEKRARKKFFHQKNSFERKRKGFDTPDDSVSSPSSPVTPRWRKILYVINLFCHPSSSSPSREEKNVNIFATTMS